MAAANRSADNANATPAAAASAPAAPQVEAVTPNTADQLARLKAIREEEQKTREGLVAARTWHEEQIAAINAQLGEDTQQQDRKRGGPRARAATPERGDNSGGGREGTMRAGVEKLLLNHRGGLSRTEITKRMLSEIGYETKSDMDVFASSVYSTGIKKLVDEGVCVKVGKRPNLIYKHKKYA